MQVLSHAQVEEIWFVIISPSLGSPPSPPPPIDRRGSGHLPREHRLPLWDAAMEGENYLNRNLSLLGAHNNVPKDEFCLPPDISGTQTAI